MNQVLFDILLERLTGDANLEPRVADILLSACHGREPLKAFLDEGQSVSGSTSTPATTRIEPPGTYLQSLQVSGFRGIGASVQLNFRPGPGLTLIVGRNGTGKSSFAEGLELLLTGDTLRWSGKTQIWSQCWRNLHQTDSTSLQAEFLVEGQSAPVKLSRSWPSGSALEQGQTVVKSPGRSDASLSDIGWAQALLVHRPILSYNEIGSMFSEGPSKLYDALSTILGLEDLVEVAKSLKEERGARESLVKDVAKRASELRQQLEPLHDERAVKCREALGKKVIDLKGLAEVLEGAPGQDNHSQVSLLRELSTLRPPSAEEAQALAARLQQLAERQSALAGTDGERAQQTAELLELALRAHDGHQDCPVCGKGLDAGWEESTRAEVTRLQTLAQEATALRREREGALAALANLVKEPPACLQRGPEVGMETTGALERWSDYAVSVTDLREIAQHLVGPGLTQLRQALQELSERAAKELESRHSEWREVHGPLTAFLSAARQAAPYEPDVKILKKAEVWLKEAGADLRAARFLPIGAAAQLHWDTLRQDSNVELGGVVLAGSGPQRRVSLDVTVDGVAGAALSVMSQGELNALALSLFLPRATLPESPFRFVVIDDPVQSMDPARVDGLAQTLEQVAKHRQVVVFTHDSRLSEAIRRLGIAADMVEVTRRENSAVEARASHDPVSRALDDAYALTQTRDLDARAAARVIPGFCRIALEAAFDQVVRRVRLGRGERHRDVESQLEKAKTLRQKASLAWFESVDGGDVEGELRRMGGHSAVNTFRLCNKGAHGEAVDNLEALVRDTQNLARLVRQ